MGSKQLHFPNTQENDIKSRTFEIEKSIKHLKEQLNSNDFWVVNAYKSLKHARAYHNLFIPGLFSSYRHKVF